MQKRDYLNAFYIISGVFFLLFPNIFWSGLFYCFDLLAFAFSLYLLLTYWEEVKRHALAIVRLAMVGNTSKSKNEPIEDWQDTIQKFWKSSETVNRENLQKFCHFSRSEAENILNFLKVNKALTRGGEKNKYIKSIDDLSPLFEEIEIIRR